VLPLPLLPPLLVSSLWLLKQHAKKIAKATPMAINPASKTRAILAQVALVLEEADLLAPCTTFTSEWAALVA
jgi:hypothetical protein